MNTAPASYIIKVLRKILSLSSVKKWEKSFKLEKKLLMGSVLQNILKAVINASGDNDIKLLMSVLCDVHNKLECLPWQAFPT